MLARMLFTISDTDGELFTVTINASIVGGASVNTITDVVMHPTWDLIKPLVTGILESAAFVLEFDPATDGWSNNIVDVLSDVQEKAKFTWFVQEAPDSKFLLTLPTIRETVFTGSGAGKVVDITDADVIAFIAFMATDGSPISIVDSHGFTLGAFRSAYQHFGKG